MKKLSLREGDSFLEGPRATEWQSSKLKLGQLHRDAPITLLKLWNDGETHLGCRAGTFRVTLLTVKLGRDLWLLYFSIGGWCFRFLG